MPELIARLLESPLPARVQRIGDQTLKRVSQRYPAVARLVSRGEKSLREGTAAALLERFGLSWPGAANTAEGPRTNPATAAAAASGPVRNDVTPDVHTPPALDESAGARASGTATVESASTAQEEPPAKRGEQAAASLLALRKGLAAISWSARAEAIQRFGEDAGAPAVPALVAALSDGSAEVAASAADCLGALGEVAEGALKGDIEQSLRFVLADPEGYWSPVTRAASVAALIRCMASGGVDDDETLGPVDDALRDIDAEVSLATIAALALLPRRISTPRLLKLLRDDSGFFIRPVRLAAARVLASVGLDDAEREALLSREHDSDVRTALSA
ncbi:MAG: hypothetical protein R3B40_19300 [Polyangiales bacterium]|nr:hypothetical protein [Sandaracinaceae bacterium]